MEFEKLIKERYSCKKYDPSKNVDDVTLKKILEAGRLAPTARNAQEQHVYVLRSEEALKKFDETSPFRYGAQTVLLVTYNKNGVYTYPNGKKTSGEEDASIVATHMMLASKNYGVDSCWLNRIDTELLKELFSIPNDEEVVMALDLGYKAEGGDPLPNHSSRKELEETVSYL
ncbi:MAG: nitroreductase family protein [Bacilli bacterium]|nr:nitroreductase family protein [Bacilli bacterium]